MKQSIIHRCRLLLLPLALCISLKSNAQSATTLKGTQNLGGQTEYSQYLYIAPAAVITLTSDWVVSSQYIFIAPTAQILGPGKMIIDNPAKFGPVPEAAAWAGQPTTIDGGNAIIMAPVQLRNPANVILGTVPIAASGGDIATANTDHTLYIGTNLDFATVNGDGSAIAGNDVVLGNNDLKIATAATITRYDANSFVVTNGTGHLYKQAYAGTFVFPVGIADGDYTPASIANAAGSNGLHVRVTNYTGAPAGSITAAPEGIDRAWHIYGDNNTTASSVCLQHNLSTNGTAYNDATTFVTQYGNLPNNTGDNPSVSGWQSNTQGPGATGTMMDPAGPVAGSSTRCRNYAAGAMSTSAIANQGWFTKSSDPISPLPVVLEYFRAEAKGCMAELSWKTATEKNFDHFEVLRSTDGSRFESIATIAGSNHAAGQVYAHSARQEAAVAYYRLKMVDVDGAVAYSSETITVNSDCSLSQEQFVVYPNPAAGSGLVNVKYETNSAKGNGKLLICDIAGRVLHTEAVSIAVGTNIFPVPVHALAAGTYIVRLVSDNGSWNLKAVKLTLNHN
jgi:hypothetical protein